MSEYSRMKGGFVRSSRSLLDFKPSRATTIQELTMVHAEISSLATSTAVAASEA